ncbi:MAG: hypothetical protein KGH49_02795, partial [Candidatus Micrarchaeota archaeon]|nr:hypothetical protein [Candidatus Micrarchaeota archaeon]
MRASRLFLGMIAIYAIISIAGATTYLQVQSPVNGTIYDGGSVFLGKVGPGESFSVIASATTTNASGGRLVNLGWNTFEAVNMPQGWIAQNSPLYENPMLLKITTPPYATNGTYRLTLRAVNIQNYSRLGNLTFTALVNVSTNVFTLNVTPTQFNIGTGQPQNLRIVINNTGISDDPFVINAAGLAGWNISDSVVALHSLKSTF